MSTRIDDVRYLTGSGGQDVRYALRTLRRNPVFAAVAVLTLALGIGVNSGIFTVVNAVLFRALSAPDAHELLSITQSVDGVPTLAGHETFSTSEYFAYRDRAQSLAGLAAYANGRGEATLGGDVPRKILGMLVSCNYFDVLQQPPAVGRAFAARDCRPGADLVVVLSHDLWRTAFRSNPAVVGRTLQLNRQKATVVGVAADGAYAGSSFLGGGYFAPLGAGRIIAAADSRYDDAGAGWLHLLGRRANGAGVQQVRAELEVIAAQLDRQQPGRSTRLTVERARPLMPQQLRGRAAAAAAVLMAAFGLVLLIACANLANLLLARGTSRSHEIGIRGSLGATRARLVRQLLTESVVLALAGGMLGTAVAVASLQPLVALALPAVLPPWFPLTLTVDVSPDLRVVAFAAALTIGTGVLFGLAPAIYVSRPDPHAVIKQDSAAGGRSRRGQRLLGTLVGVQVALCMVLVIAAALVLRGLHAAYTIDPGFAYRNVAYVSLESVFDGDSPEEAEATRRRLLTEVGALPVVESIASTDQEPLGDDIGPALFRLPGETVAQSRVGEVIAASGNYFSVLELPIVRGRAFTENEARNDTRGPRPAIVTVTTASNLWPGAEPIGRTLLWQRPGIAGADTLHVVGVAADAQITALGEIDPYYVYVPGEGGVVLVKGRADIATTISGIRDVVRSVDPTLVVTVLPLEATLDWSRGISRTVTGLFAASGALALVLASVGIYGVVSFLVAGRYREIGIRLALGATASSVLSLILRQTMRPVVAGAVIGAVAAAGVSRVLSTVLFGISPADPFALGSAAVLVLGVALAAGLIAARPASQADPTATLRYE
jgi:predicted permease